MLHVICCTFYTKEATNWKKEVEWQKNHITIFIFRINVDIDLSEEKEGRRNKLTLK